MQRVNLNELGKARKWRTCLRRIFSMDGLSDLISSKGDILKREEESHLIKSVTGTVYTRKGPLEEKTV